jgi:hypothetical protein
MTDPDPTVQQMIRQDIRDMREDFNKRLDRLVSTEAHAADMRRIDERFTSMARDVASNQKSRQDAMADEQKEREREDTLIIVRLDKTALLVRWALASVVITVAALVLTFVLILKGIGKV